ncbi:NUDIX hydrolase [Rothia sp. ZJ1223]|uniref:NUDIX domain-containing protein n=1 Tax=Rothia sp. ZJ1223 TaxID=2811098 RepID=UPI001956AC04|nr:NUDIX hydrolase [Rothia sp. ZJ1223]
MNSYLPQDELVKFIESLPTRRLAAAALIRDEKGRMLAVKPNYKDGWTMPGGTVEAGESPKVGCFREVIEEVGLDLEPGRLLLLFHGLQMGIWGDSTYYIYDGGVIDSSAQITLQEEELTEYRWVAEEDLDDYFSASFTYNLRQCYRALETGCVVELDSSIA